MGREHRGQIKQCTEYTKYNDMEIVGTYIDRACSARTVHRHSE